MSSFLAVGGFCEECDCWTFMQGDELPSEFLEPNYCGQCGNEVDTAGEFEVIEELTDND